MGRAPHSHTRDWGEKPISGRETTRNLIKAGGLVETCTSIPRFGANDMNLKPGQNLLHYRIAEQIGEGGMGEAA